jgi:hypothetical protein
MSRPGPPQREPRPYDWQRQFQQPDYQHGQGRPPYGNQPYRQPDHQEQPYQPYSEYPYADQSYAPPAQQPQYRQPGAPSPREMYPDTAGPRFRLPGIGLIFGLVGAVVQILCMLVLPWVSASAAGGQSPLKLWDFVSHASGAQGFGGWYVVLFSYPLAALGIVLALVSALEWVAGKVLFAALAILGIGYLLVRYGVGPAAGLFGESGGFHFSRQEISTIGIAVAALVIVIFMLRTGLAMFRRIGGVILLIVAGVHIYAVRDLFDGAQGVSIGAYGPALGFALSGIAALIGPRRFSPG